MHLLGIGNDAHDTLQRVRKPDRGDDQCDKDAMPGYRTTGHAREHDAVEQRANDENDDCREGKNKQVGQAKPQRANMPR